MGFARRFAQLTAGVTALATALFGSVPVSASSGGYTVSPDTTTGCNGCHGGGTTPTVNIYQVPSYVAPSSTTCMYNTVGTSQARAGVNVFASAGNMSVGAPSGFPYSAGTRLIVGASGRNEITHTAPKAKEPGSQGSSYIYFSWCWTAPATPGLYTISVWGNNVSFAGDGTAGDAAKVTSINIPVCYDNDGDGYFSSTSPDANCPNVPDCNDSCITCNAGAAEVCDNLNNDCNADATVDEGCDDDNDNYCDSSMSKTAVVVSTCTATGTGAGNDCADTDATVNPAATEICNGKNDDCAGSPAVDGGCDDDGDGYCDPGMTRATGATCAATDCNDNSSAISPAGSETCSNQAVDNDCDGNSSELNDGVFAGDSCSTGLSGICAAGTRACSSGSLVCVQTFSSTTETCANFGTDDDCDNNANEIANGINNNQACTTGQPGICSAGTYVCSGGAVQCSQTNAPGTETCSNTGTDNDCDNDATELTNGVHAGDACDTGLLGVCAAGTRACAGTNLGCTQTTASSTEKCDGLDNNCNGQTDEGCDDDNDDYCDVAITTVGTPSVCPFGGGDCNDTSNVSKPGAAEICDGLDNDCDSTPDDNIAAVTCGLGECQATSTACVGGVPQNCTPGTPGTETCSNTSKDNDCDGDAVELENNVHTGDACSTGLPGICAAGTRICSSGALGCAQTNVAGSETCANAGTDNDCDGDAAELTNGIHAGEACTTGLPGVCSAGTYACQGGAVVCVQTNPVGTETCLNQNLDNDCDGDANELTNGVHDNDTCVTGQPGECSAGKQHCTSGSLLCIANKQSVPEFCDGRDNDCNGQNDDGLPNLTCGTGECANSVPACANGANNSCTPKASSAEVCDDKDNDCNGVTDNGCDDDNDDYCDANLTYSGSPAVCPLGDGDCDDTTGSSHPNALELCDGEDNDCNGAEDDDVQALTCGVGECVNQASGCTNGVPENCTPKPQSAEVCDGKDNDCDGVNDNDIALSTCGVGECARVGTTCFAASCVPGTSVSEVCDSKDNDCDGVIDNGLPMAKCGVGACERTGTTCDPASCVPGGSGFETCDGEDDNCNGVPDDGLPLAECGVGECKTTGTSCLPASCIPLEPADVETCDGKDNDCDGEVDNGCDDDNDGWCDFSLEFVESPLCPNGGGDCDDLLADSYPGAQELCDDKDNDCDGTLDDDVTEPTCGVGACKALGTACVGGEAENCTPGQPVAETCDGVDNDCNGLIDDALPAVTCGVGACAVEMVGCRQGNAVKCVPAEPESQETCDGVDNDCNGDTDEGDLCANGFVCVAGACEHMMTSTGGSAQGGFGGLSDTQGPASLGGGGYGASDNDVLPPKPTSNGGGGDTEDDGGCGCVVVGGTPSSAGWALSTLVALAWARRRRRLAEDAARERANRSLS